MDKDWRTILQFAAVGLVSAALVMAVQFLPNSSSPNYSLMAVSILLCPASLLAAPFFAWFFEAAEVGTSLFYVLWSFTALANAALYAVLGAAYVGLRKKPKGTAAG